MDNIIREMRNRSEINNNIPGMDMEPDGNEYKNVGGKKVENYTNIEGLMQYNIQEQKRENKITSSVTRQTELSQTPNKRSVSVSNGIRQSEDTSVEGRVKGWDNDSKQNSNQRVEVVDKENRVIINKSH
ncbi:MAG: hypothetical protein EZS28_026300 [Streblomastix strix]|uniref:Uncharacterized protein n=1 Tax=Streblomastix strix TaxID=222440 RepID=A0A5J4V6X3_9EUKA|nr:MAG: hypothetical protein EZS28_026299 [Streblomastix strix]KAA6378174.1 MAG: hypothetical protein EZS28_026300 [Streblomastix strix]